MFNRVNITNLVVFMEQLLLIRTNNIKFLGEDRIAEYS